MKKLLPIVACFVFLFFLSCQDDLVLENKDPIASERAAIIDQPLNAQAEYHYKHLGTLAKGLLYQSQNSLFREHLYSKVSEKFDGETSVLIDILVDSYGREKFYSSVKESFNEHNIRENFDDGLRAFDFRGINGQQYFPHVYIPFFEEDSGKELVARRDKSKPPVVVIEDPIEETDAIPGYTLNAEGEVVKLDFLITEEYAEKNEVWVIAFNEHVRSAEDFEKITSQKPFSYGPNNGRIVARDLDKNCNDGRTAGVLPDPEFVHDDGIDVIAKGLTITSRKESWYRGDSEIEMELTATEGTPGAIRLWGQIFEYQDTPTGTVIAPKAVIEVNHVIAKLSKKVIKKRRYTSVYVNLTHTGWSVHDRRATPTARSAWIGWKTILRNADVGNGGDVEDPRADYILWVGHERDYGFTVSRKRATINWTDEGVNRSGYITYQSRNSEYRADYFDINVNSQHYPCGQSTFDPSNNPSGTFYFDTERSANTAVFDFD